MKKVVRFVRYCCYSCGQKSTVPHSIGPLLFSFILSFLLFSARSQAQIVDGNGYAIGSFLEIAVDGNGGHEGTADWPGHHSRGGTPEVPFGFVANPQLDGWFLYDGDFFTAGIPENGFGLEINGTNYSNNAWDNETSTPYLNEIPATPGGNLTHTIEGECIIIEWEGQVAGVTIGVQYRLLTGDLFYTTQITLTNTTGTDLTDLYYYRNVDPDNNESVGGSFITTNTIVSQPDETCIKALVSAEQFEPWESYLGIGSLGDNFRVSHGGFSNRDGSDIWNAAAGLNGSVGSIVTDDESISIAYKTDLAAGETTQFTYAVVLSAGSVEAAFSSLYYISYESNLFDDGSGGTNPCEVDNAVARTCRGDELTLFINGPDLYAYDWTWGPDPVSEGLAVNVSPTEETSYTVIGSPTMECLSGVIIKNISVLFTEGPQISMEDPGPVCEEVNLDTVTFTDAFDGEHTVCNFFTEMPDSATQTSPLFPGPIVTQYDDVWMMCGDTVTGCFDRMPLMFNFIGPDAAGLDTTYEVCGGPGTVIDLTTLLSDSANIYGHYHEITESGGALNETTGLFNPLGATGVFEFEYIVDPFLPCPGDTAILTVIIEDRPSAGFYYEAGGQSSLDGLGSICINNEVDFFDISVIPPPFSIVEWSWDFGDGGTSDIPNPSHTFEEPGVYVVSLVVFSENGCEHTYAQSLEIYTAPSLEIEFSAPGCHGYTDGFIEVFPNVLPPYTLTITDGDGTVHNGDTTIALNLAPGTYLVELEDNAGCFAEQELILTEPPAMEIYARIGHPPCTADSGFVVVDSVAGENPNNPITYDWRPNPAGISGPDADSSYWMKAGDYTVIVTDSKGCQDSAHFTLIDPPPFYFTDWGWDTAYCRLYSYQSGNGVVYAAAAGGIPNYTYEWTYLVDGTTSNNSTWGGRNPGDHLITITDDGGCQLTKIITVDSVNPIASFTLASADLNANCEGTADVAVEFTNTSRYYANPNNPNADTTFLWDLHRTEEDDWMISHDFYEKFDTVYKARGASYQVDVCLIAMNKNGCKDTACKTITIWEPPEINPVNIFTPNGEGENDVFTLENYAKGIKKFHCIIVNRWGVQVGEINSIGGYWNGDDLNGDPCTDGVYFYTYTAEGDNGTPFAGQGTVTLVGRNH